MQLVPAPRPDLFISADVETDGPIPGEYSMLSFALTLAGSFDGSRFERFEPRPENALYLELKPISARFQPEALAVNGLDRAELQNSGAEPAEAMRAASAWVRGRAGPARPVLVAYPVAFDWSFLYWYFIHFTGDSPFGFSSCLDIRTLYQSRALTTFDHASQTAMPSWLRPRREHTHHAIDDAWEQGELFVNLFTWALRQGADPLFTSSPEGHAPNWLEPLVDPISYRSHDSSIIDPLGRLRHRITTPRGLK